MAQVLTGAIMQAALLGLVYARFAAPGARAAQQPRAAPDLPRGPGGGGGELHRARDGGDMQSCCSAAFEQIRTLFFPLCMGCTTLEGGTKQ